MKNLKIEVWDQLHRINKLMMPEPRRPERPGQPKRPSSPLIGRGQVKILKEILNESNLSQDELAKRARVDKTTVAKSVKKMESMGLLSRVKSNTDQRKYQLVATEKAEEMIKRMDEHLTKGSEELFEGVSELEIQNLMSTLDKLEDNLNNKRVQRDQLHNLGKNILKKLKKAGKIEREKLLADLEVIKRDFDDVLLRLIERQLVKEEKGLLYLNEDFEVTHMRHLKDRDLRMVHGKHPEHRDLFRMIMESNGLTVEELAEKTELPIEEVSRILKPAFDYGAITLKDDLIYPNKDIPRRKRPF